MGFMTGDEAGQSKTLTSFLAWKCVAIYALCKALHRHAEKWQVRYLHEKINYFINNNGCLFKRLRGWIDVLTQ